MPALDQYTPFTGRSCQRDRDSNDIMAVNNGMFNIKHAFLATLRATRGGIIPSVHSFWHMRTPDSGLHHGQTVRSGSPCARRQTGEEWRC